MKNGEDKTRSRKTLKGEERDGEQGFLLLGLIVACALILIALSVAASRMAFTLRREREVESVHRANQYVRAIQLYYRKMGSYPGSVKQLEDTNHVRYLRKQYVDPLTGKADYRLIVVGQNKTTVKGFFGEPLTGLGPSGLGAAAGMQSSGFGGSAATPGASGASGTFGSSGVSASAGVPGGAGSTSFGGSSGALGGSSGFGNAPGQAGSSGPGSSSGPGGAPGSGGASGLGSLAGMASSGMGGSTGPIMGVGSSATGPSILQPNGQSTYQTWEFLYDPRVELLKAAAALNGGAGSVGAGALGQSQSGFGQSQSGFGQSVSGSGQQSNGFGSSGFGSSSFGSSGPGSNGPGQSPSAPGGPGSTPFP